MNKEEFFNKLKQEEINFYDNLVRQYNELDVKRSEFQPKDDSEEEYSKWRDYRNKLTNISNDYDVSDYSNIIIRSGEDKYKSLLQRRIDEHIGKLYKSIKKEVGEVVSVNEISSNTYNVEGNNGTCKILVSPVKVGPSGMVVKTRIKISDVVKRDKPLDYVPEKEDNEYIKQWKENEFQEYLKINENFWKQYEELHTVYKEKYETFRNAVDNYRIEHHGNPEISGRHGYRYYDYADESIQKLNLEYIEANQQLRDLIDRNRFFYDNGHKSNYEELFRKAINDHFKKLQSKVENKIGEIVKIEPLSNNGADYHFEGTNGSCNVEVILAGGYNIQRLHTRWIVTNVRTNGAK